MRSRNCLLYAMGRLLHTKSDMSLSYIRYRAVNEAYLSKREKQHTDDEKEKKKRTRERRGKKPKKPKDHHRGSTVTPGPQAFFRAAALTDLSRSIPRGGDRGGAAVDKDKGVLTCCGRASPKWGHHLGRRWIDVC